MVSRKGEYKGIIGILNEQFQENTEESHKP